MNPSNTPAVPRGAWTLVSRIVSAITGVLVVIDVIATALAAHFKEKPPQ